MFHDVFRSGHDFGHSGLVIGSEKGGTIGCDDGLADVVFQLGELFRIQLYALGLVEDDSAAVVVLHYAWPDAAAGSVRGRVHV